MTADWQVRKHAGESLPLLLLPGTLCDARIFGPLRRRLPGIEAHAILTAGARSISEAAEKVLAAAPPAFALLGFSLGGIVAMEIALRAPGRVRGLALLQTTPLPVPAERHAARRAAVDEARRRGLRHYLRKRLWPEYCGAVACDTSRPLLEDMAESTGLDTFSQQVEMALTRADYRERLSEVACPTLVLSGAGDKVCPPEARHALETALPGCTSVTLPGAGHLALLERPDEIAHAVAAWFHTVQQLYQARAGVPPAPERC